MSVRKSVRAGIAMVLVGVHGLVPAAAALPGLKQPPWLGQFLAYKDRKFTFEFNCHAEGKITPVGKSDKPVNMTLVVPVLFVVEEILPAGRAVTRKILLDTLATDDLATAKPGKVSFRGKVTGGAGFEGHLEVVHGAVLLGGRLLDSGMLRKNPLRFSIRLNFPNAYHHASEMDKKTAKAFENTLRDDHFSILHTNDKHLRLNGNDKITSEPRKINGPGIREIKIDVAAYQGKVFSLTAGENSNMMLWSRVEQPLHDGYSVIWYPDPATDPEGKARLKFELK